MTSTDTTTAVTGTDLPPLPADPRSGDGYDWIDDLRGGWRPLACWGRDGWSIRLCARCACPSDLQT